MNPVLKRIITALTTAALVVLAIVYLPTKALPPIFSVVMALAVIEFALLLSAQMFPGRLRPSLPAACPPCRRARC